MCKGGGAERKKGRNAFNIFRVYATIFSHLSLDFELCVHFMCASRWNYLCRYTFRREMKMLDHRLAALIDQGFEEASTVAQSFKLFDSFQGLVERPLIYERLETRYLEVIAMYAADLRAVQDVFVRLCDNPPVASHVSPCAGALAWSFGLEARARGPMLKVKRLDKRVLDSAIGREVIADFTSLVGYLEGYRKDVLLDWMESVKEVITGGG